MLIVTQTTTPVMNRTFRNFMVFQTAMLNNSSPFYPTNKNASKSLHPSSLDKPLWSTKLDTQNLRLQPYRMLTLGASERLGVTATRGYMRCRADS